MTNTTAIVCDTIGTESERFYRVMLLPWVLTVGGSAHPQAKVSLVEAKVSRSDGNVARAEGNGSQAEAGRGRAKHQFARRKHFLVRRTLEGGARHSMHAAREMQHDFVAFVSNSQQVTRMEGR